MSEWLDLMLEEVARKKREAKEAGEEAERRKQPTSDQSHDKQTTTAPTQSK